MKSIHFSLPALLLFISTASALPPLNTGEEGLAVKGYDTVAYFTVGEPVMGVFAFGSDAGAQDVFAIGDVMDEKGWHLDRQKGPDALHLMLSPAHAEVADAFLADLRDAAAHHGESKGKEARYS